MTYEEVNELLKTNKYRNEALSAFNYNNIEREASICDTCTHTDCNLAPRCREVFLPVVSCNFYEGEEVPFNKAKKIWNSNVPHTTAEVIEGFPTGNVLVGMTHEDFEKLCTYFEEKEE